MKLQNSSTDNFILKVGDKAPDFTLKTEMQQEWRLSGQFGNVVALLFYPKNETLVCTRQMCSVRDNWLEYLNTKACVVGISPGTADENEDFSKRFQLPLPILGDANRKVTRLFGKHWLIPIQLTRAIVIIDAHGFVRCRRVMMRAFRPSDNSVIASIYAARTDVLQEHYRHLVVTARKKNRHNY